MDSKFKMLPLKEGCLCCSLRTCVLIQGWFYSVLTTIMVLLTLGMFSVLDDVYYNKGDQTEERRNVLSFGTAVLYTVFVLVFLCAGIQYTMLVGVYKGRAWMLVPHLTLTAFATLGVAIFVLVNKQTGFLTVFCTVLFVCIQTYFWFNVFSHYLELKRKAVTVAPV